MILELGLLHRNPDDTKIFSDFMKKSHNMETLTRGSNNVKILYIDFEKWNLPLKRNNYRIHIKKFVL